MSNKCIEEHEDLKLQELSIGKYLYNKATCYDVLPSSRNVQLSNINSGVQEAFRVWRSPLPLFVTATQNLF